MNDWKIANVCVFLFMLIVGISNPNAFWIMLALAVLTPFIKLAFLGAATLGAMMLASPIVAIGCAILCLPLFLICVVSYLIVIK